MEYSDIYDINRKMHAAPRCDVFQKIKELREQHPGLEIILEEPETGEHFDWEKIILLLTIQGPFTMGRKVKVTAIGEYILETLRECADGVGSIFSLKPEEDRTTHDILLHLKV